MDVEDSAVGIDWEERHDDASGQIYYWNVLTGETSWEPPHLVDSEELPSVEELPHPWTQAFDDNGRVYFLNTETMETMWTPPDEQLNGVLDSSDTDTLTLTGDRGRRPSTAEQMVELNRLLSGESDEEDESEEMATVVEQREASEVLQSLDHTIADNHSCPWMMFVNEDNGEPYYYNHITGDCLWDPPEEFLRFHHDQQDRSQETPARSENGSKSEAPVVSEVSENASLNAEVIAAGWMKAAITPEFEEKVRQAIAAVSNTPVNSSRLVLVRTPTQEQLALRTGRSTGTGSASSIPNSSRSSRPSSAAVRRPRTAEERVASSSLDPVPTVDVLTAEIVQKAGDEEVPVVNADEFLKVDGVIDEIKAKDDNDAEISPSEEAEDNNEEPAIDTEEAQHKDVDEESTASTGVKLLPGGLDVLAAEISANTVQGIDLATEVNVTEDGIEEHVKAPDEGEMEIEANVETARVDSHFEVDEAVPELSALNVATSEINEHSDLEREQTIVVVADEMSDDLPSIEFAALTLQCLIRCFIARRRMKREREEQNDAKHTEMMDFTPGSSSSILADLPGEHYDTDIIPSSSTLTEIEEQETTPTFTVEIGSIPAVAVLVEEQLENLEIPSSSTTTIAKEDESQGSEFTTPSEDIEEKTIQTKAKTQPSMTETVVVNSESLALLPSSVEVSSQSTSAQSELRVADLVEMPSSTETYPVSSTKRIQDDTLPQDFPFHQEAASCSTRLPSILNITTFFPRRSWKSPQPAPTGTSSSSAIPVAITRKKIVMESPLRARRASQQELMDQVQVLETRKRDEERVQRAQVLEYQRIYAESRKVFKTEKKRLLEEKLVRDNERQHDAEIEKQARIRFQYERDELRTRPKAQADEILWNHLKLQSRPTDQSVTHFRLALTETLNSVQFPNKMCAERARELHERIERLHRASWAVDSQLETVELHLLSELHPLTDRQRPLQAKYAAKLRCHLEQMLNRVQAWQRVLDDWEAGKENGLSRYWSTIQAQYESLSIYKSDESRRQYILNVWRGAAGGDSLLHVAAWKGWEEHVRLLVNEGADVNLIDSSASHRTPLHEACEAGNVAIVELLLRSGARLSSVDVSGDSALHFACRKGWTRVVRVLLMAANDLREDDDQSCTNLTLKEFFNLRNGKGRRAVDVVKLPSLLEELESYDYQLNGKE